MRILTHNSLKCPSKTATKGYPLQLEVSDMEIIETECDIDFMKALLPGLHWPGVVLAAKAVGLQDLPNAFTTELLEDKNFIMAMHNLLLDVHVKEGILTCPDTGSKFPILKGIPNMNMDESEV